MNEEQRYAAVQQQLKDLLDAAAIDPNPATNLLRALLYAEMYERNELTHQRATRASARTPDPDQGWMPIQMEEDKDES